jgi:hypothetical protein
MLFLNLDAKVRNYFELTKKSTKKLWFINPF